MKIVVCLSVVRGNGAKYICTNLAHYTKIKDTNKKVILLDFDFEHPYLCESLVEFDKVHGIDNVVNKIEAGASIEDIFDEDIIKLKSGVELLKGTKMKNAENVINNSHLEIILDFIKNNYDYVFINTSNITCISSAFTIFNADEIIIVAKNNYSNYGEFNNLKTLIKNYKSKNSKLNLVINQYNKKPKISFEDFIDNDFLIENTVLIPLISESIDNLDLDKSLLKSKLFKSKGKVEKVFSELIDVISEN